MMLSFMPSLPLCSDGVLEVAAFVFPPFPKKFALLLNCDGGRPMDGNLVFDCVVDIIGI